MKKTIIAVVLLSIGVWVYCYWFAAFGTRKFYKFKGGDSVKTETGYVSVNLYESDFPYRLSFFYYPRPDVTLPARIQIEDVVLTGCNTQHSYEYGSLSGEMDRIAIISFEVIKEKGMKYEPYDVEATVRMLFEDGSEQLQKFSNHIKTDLRERDRIPRWHYLFM